VFMLTAFRSSGLAAGLTCLFAFTACSGSGSSVVHPSEHQIDVPSVPQLLVALPRSQQDAIRASTPANARWLSDISLRRRVGAARHDRWYAMATHENGGRSVRSARQAREVYALTSCITTYENVSGTYDTSTDPIVFQQCSTTYYDDGGALPSDNGGNTIALPTLDPNLYKEPASNFDTATERGCKINGAKFISVSKKSTATSSDPSPGQTHCGPKDQNSELELTGGRLFPYPGGCDFLVVVGARSISVNWTDGFTVTSMNDGIRINANCSYDFPNI
jgi:hypothetical protein